MQDADTLLRAEAAGPVTLDGATLDEGMCLVLDDLAAKLLGWTAAVRAEMGPEAVHQARVATRRLRSALSIFRRVHPALAPMADEVRRCATVLGAVRDWDVFLAGTGASMAELEDRRVMPLLRAADRRRDAAAAALADYLAGAEFGQLRQALGQAPPWQEAPWQEAGAADWTAGAGSFPAFAAAVLSRCLKRVRHRGRSLDGLPAEALHELRKECKRLRYAAEFFAPAFPGRSAKPLLRRLADVQAHLGLLNDAASCTELVAQLGRSGRGYAGGLATGLALAQAQPVREQVRRSWKRFRKAEPFWR